MNLPKTGQQRTLQLNDESQKAFKNIKHQNRINKAAMIYTPLTAGFLTYLSWGVLLNPAYGLPLYAAALGCHALNICFSAHQWQTRSNEAAKETHDLQVESYVKNSLRLLDESFDEYIESLRGRNDQTLSEEDIQILSLLPEEKYKDLPGWIGLNHLQDIKRNQKEMSSLKDHFKEKAEAGMKSTDFVKNDELSNFDTVAIIMGILPFVDLFRYPYHKISDTETVTDLTEADFQPPEPEKPYLPTLVNSLTA